MGGVEGAFARAALRAQPAGRRGARGVDGGGKSGFFLGGGGGGGGGMCHGIWRFPGEQSNLCHSSDPSSCWILNMLCHKGTSRTRTF